MLGLRSSLQVKPRSMFDCVAFSFDFHNRDHVKPFELRISFRFKLPNIRGILLNLIDVHVKHMVEPVKLRRDHVKHHQKLPCSGALELCSVADMTEFALPQK